ncbi:uncharacterized protein LOC133393615 [Anopheles gambiae]|uniref:uncharacterized protein LOC125907240 n=1 Tax=Anopheles coluzzii TaxID=1518534 RepID=UPI0020FF882E|nr:uncharacterized protein LOC125907240 [Anopheles coluzzii]XP_061515254.1 uncharacterized protein LOC133393615 [Anopheles gambiae]
MREGDILFRKMDFNNNVEEKLGDTIPVKPSSKKLEAAISTGSALLKNEKCPTYPSQNHQNSLPPAVPPRSSSLPRPNPQLILKTNIASPIPFPIAPPRTTSLSTQSFPVQSISFRAISTPASDPNNTFKLNSPTIPPRSSSLMMPNSSPVQNITFLPKVPVNTESASHPPTLPPRSCSVSLPEPNRKLNPTENLTQLDRIEKQLNILSKVACHTQFVTNLVLDNLCNKDSNSERNPLIKKMETLDMLEEMERKLKHESLYMAKTICLLLSALKGTDNVQERLSITLDLLFDRDFFSKFSWTGVGFPEAKIPLEKYVYIISLFKFVGGTSFIDDTATVSHETVKTFLVDKRNHGKARSLVKGLRHTVKRKKEL